VFDFPLTHIVPCMLHVTMALIRTLLKRLCEEANNNIELATELTDRLQGYPLLTSLDVASIHSSEEIAQVCLSVRFSCYD